MAYVKVSDILKRRGKNAPSLVNKDKSEKPGGIRVCIGNCSHCAKLKTNVLTAAERLGIPDDRIETVTDIAQLMRMGIMTTPALIVNGKLVSIGKVLSPDQCEALLRANGYGKEE